MTTVRVTTFGTDLTTEKKSRVAERITGAFAAVEVGADNELIRAGFSVLFESLGADDLWVGGKQATEIGGAGRAALITVRVWPARGRRR